MKISINGLWILLLSVALTSFACGGAGGGGGGAAALDVTVNRAITQDQITNNLPITFTVVFTEAIDPTTFIAGDITTGGTATGVTWGAPATADNITWTLSATAVTGNGTIIPSLLADVVQTTGGTSNNASTSTDNSVTYDGTAPIVNISYTQGGNTAGPFKEGTLTIRATYSETLTSDPTISIDQQGATDITNAGMTNLGGGVYTYDYTIHLKAGSDYEDGTATVSLSSTSDSAGNPSGTPTNNSFVIDTSPIVNITYTQGTNTAGPFKAGALTIRATYSETLTSGPTISIDQQGTTDITDDTMTDLGSGVYTYNYTINTGVGYSDGTATVSLSTTTDSGGNTSGAPTNNTFDIDTTAPAFIALNPGEFASDNSYVDISFTEGVYHSDKTKLTPADLTLVPVYSNVTNITISSLKKTDSVIEGTASDISPGESTIRVFLSITGYPNGTDSIEILTKSGASQSVYDYAGNYADTAGTTGVLYLNVVSAVVSFNQATGSYNENGDADIQIDFLFMLTQNVTFNYSFTAGSPSATGGTSGNWDYNNSTTSLLVNSGVNHAHILVPINDDTLVPIDEYNEKFIITLLPGSDYALKSPTIHTATIGDDDDPPTVGFTAASQSSTNESNASTMTITAQLSAASGKDVSVPFTLSGTATNGTDYNITASPITIAAGNTTGTATITIIGDSLDEDNETVTLTMGTPVNANASGNTTHTATITDDDASPTVSINNVSQNEGNSGTINFTFTVTLSAASGRSASVDYATANGSATVADNDYTAASDTLTFNAGETSKQVTVLVTGDATLEGNQTFTVNLSSLVNITSSGSTLTGTGTILDDDAATPTVSFAAPSTSASESVTSAVLTINLSPAPNTGSVTVNYTIAGSGTYQATVVDDYTNSTSVIVPQDSTSYTISIPIINDSKDENNESFTVTLTSGTGYTVSGTQYTHVYTINDDDPAPQIYFTQSTSATANETSAMNVEVRLSSISGKNVTVTITDLTGTVGYTGTAYATPGTDYSISPTTGNTLTITAGNLTNNIVLTGGSDTNDETAVGTQTGEKTVFTISTPVNATLGAISTHTATITDDDGVGILSIADASVAENLGPATVRISCIGVASACTPYTVNYATSNGTAVAGSDYTATSGTAGTWSGTAPNYYKDITIPITNDTISELNETILVTLSGNTGGSIADASGEVTITDNETPFTISSAETLDCEGGANGKLDHYKITFSEAVDDSTFSGWVADNTEGNVTSKLFVAGRNNVRLDPGTALDSHCGTDALDNSIIYIRFDELTSVDTGETPDLTAVSETLSAVSGVGKLYYNTGNVASTGSTGVTETDKAGPFIWKAVASDTMTNPNSQPDDGDKLTISFSEPMNGYSFASLLMDTYFTLSSHSFGIAGGISSATWTATDTLVITFNGTTTATVVPGDTISLKDAGINDDSGNTPALTMITPPVITGAFENGPFGPVVASATYLDTDGNGRIDHVKVTFNRAITDSTVDGYVSGVALGSVTTKWSVSGYTNVRFNPTLSVDTANDATIYLKFSEGLDYDTAYVPDLTATTSNIQGKDTTGCYINENITECGNGTNTNGNVSTTEVVESDGAKAVFTSATARVGDRYVFVRFSENVWGQEDMPACGSGGELIQDASIRRAFAYTNGNSAGAASIESVDGTENCAATDAFTRLFADSMYIDGDLNSDTLRPYNDTAIYDAANNAMDPTKSIKIQETVAPYVVGASSFYDSTGVYGTINTSWLRIVFSEPMHYVRTVTAANYTLSVDDPGTCTTINAIPLSVRAISSTIFDLQTDIQCGDTVYKITASNNILDLNEIEPVGSPNVGTTFGTASSDTTKPKLIQALSIDSQSVQITFSEPVVSAGATTGTNYTITPSLGTPLTVIATTDPSVYVVSHPNYQTGSFYTISGNTTNIKDIANQTLAAIPNNQATFRGQGQVVEEIDDGPLFSDPFADGSSFSFAFGYNDKVYLGPNDTDSGAYRFEPDGANPLMVNFHAYYSGIDYYTFKPGPNAASAISFFQSGTVTDNSDSILKDYLFLVPIGSPKINSIWFTKDLDSQLDYYQCGLSTSAGMQGGSSVSYSNKYMFLGVIVNAKDKAPVFRKYSLSGTTCTELGASTWNNDTQDLPGIGSNGGNISTDNEYIGIDAIFVNGSTLYMGNNGGVVYANTTNGFDDLDAKTDFSSLVNESGGCSSSAVPNQGTYNWCTSGYTLRVNAAEKIPPGRKGIPFIVSYTDSGNNTALLMARNVTSSFAGKTRTGGELWKCTTSCTTRNNWSRVFTTTASGSNSGMEIRNNEAISMLIVNGTKLYVGFDNLVEGSRVYYTTVVPTSKSSFTELGRIADAGCTNHSGDSGALGGYCYTYQILSSTSQSKQGYNYLFFTSGCRENTSDGGLCDTLAGAGFQAPPIRVLIQKD